jgi:hypothetical protein
MSELDDRISNGLHELVGRAPRGDDVWEDTMGYVRKHTRRRYAMAAAVAAIAVLAGVAAIANANSPGRKHTSVAITPTTVPAPTTANTTPKTTPRTTPTTTPAVHVADPCVRRCIGRGTADVDGDGRPDRIGYMASAVDSFGSATAVDLRVAFANGRTADWRAKAFIQPAWLGAKDFNGDGMAEIFVFDTMGAHAHSGKIIRWNGSGLVPVVADGSGGQPFTIVVDNYVMGATGFGCDGNRLYETSVSFGGTDTNQPGPWNGTKTLYEMFEGAMVKTTEQPVHFTGYWDDISKARAPELEQIDGVHCDGLPKAPTSSYK